MVPRASPVGASAVIVDAEFNEIEGEAGELDLTEDDGLPWLEADEEDDRAGGLDSRQLVAFVAILLLILVAVVALVYIVSNYNRGPAPVADGSTIEAPEGPYKERPDESGGKTFAGTGDVAPSVGQGETPESRLANGADAGDGDLNIAMPPIEGGGAAARNGQTESQNSAPKAATDTKGVGVQLAAYGSRARADKGWTELKRKSAALGKYKYRVVEGQIDIGTVYRLQAVTRNRSEAEALCRTLKAEGLDCQVKP
jgi:hypothetical protein